jgi:hypothetical protein
MNPPSQTSASLVPLLQKTFHPHSLSLDGSYAILCWVAFWPTHALTH